MLPFEDEVRQEIEVAAQKELAAARELLRLALAMLGSDGNGNLRIPSTPVPGVGNWARSIALGLYAKACKQFRTIIMVGETGFGGEVTVLTRAVLETALALGFVLQGRVVLKSKGR